MATTSKNGSSLHAPDRTVEDEKTKTAPSRETTHDDPQGKDVRIGRKHAAEEQAPDARPEPPDED